MDIYVIANPLLLHIVKGLRIGLRLVWHWTHVLCKWGWWGPGAPGPSMTSPTISLTAERRHGEAFPSCWVRTLSWSSTLCSGQPLLGAGGSERGPALPRVSVCLLPDLFHFRICFQLLCNYRLKKKKPSNATERYKIRHPTLWNLSLIIVNQVVST